MLFFQVFDVYLMLTQELLYVMSVGLFHGLKSHIALFLAAINAQMPEIKAVITDTAYGRMFSTRPPLTCRSP